MVVVLVIDLITPANIRLHMLYLFPLVAITLHCEKISAIIIGITVASSFQILTFYIDGVPTIPLVTDACIAFLSALMAVILARIVRKDQLKLENLSSTDGLTGLRNRRSFEEIVDVEIERQKRYGGILSLVVLDLDGFKKLNDDKGHHAGDLALKLFARILNDNSRQLDTVARLGGDEFAILMPSTLAEDCRSHCQLLSEKIASQMNAANFQLTASIGFSTFEQPPDSITTALHLADKAMYAAKAGGKNRVAGV
jgi:diguanylate cyclase (GGDEF)-like protein